LGVLIITFIELSVFPSSPRRKVAIPCRVDGVHPKSNRPSLRQRPQSDMA
jgi:hypothetical protein